MRKYIVLLSVTIFLVTSIGLSQIASNASPAFSFKGNYLGMTLEEFKSRNSLGEVWVATGKPNVFGRANKKDEKLVKVPLCTDQMRGFPGDPGNLVDDEVACNASPGATNPDGKSILDVNLDAVLYLFYRDKLYSISMVFDTADYGAIRDGFLRKYGDSPVASSESFQNGYGASWTGEILTWYSGSQAVRLAEGSANGPGQLATARALHPSTAAIVDASLSPQKAKSKIDF